MTAPTKKFDFTFRPESYEIGDAAWYFYGSGGVMIESATDSYVSYPVGLNQRDIVYFYSHDWVHGGSWNQAIRVTKNDAQYQYDFIDAEDGVSVPPLHSSMPLTFQELTDFILSIKSKRNPNIPWIESKWQDACELVDSFKAYYGSDEDVEYPETYEEGASRYLEVDTPFYHELYDWIDFKRQEWLGDAQ